MPFTRLQRKTVLQKRKGSRRAKATLKRNNNVGALCDQIPKHIHLRSWSWASTGTWVDLGQASPDTALRRTQQRKTVLSVNTAGRLGNPRGRNQESWPAGFTPHIKINSRRTGSTRERRNRKASRRTRWKIPSQPEGKQSFLKAPFIKSRNQKDKNDALHCIQRRTIDSSQDTMRSEKREASAWKKICVVCHQGRVCIQNI